MPKRTVYGITLTLLLISMSTLAFNIQTVEAEHTTWTVDDDGPADFHTIQEAINVADHRDVIYVYNGTYYENVVVNKTVSLFGESADNTIIDGGGIGIVVNATSNNVVITKFTVRNSGLYFPNSGICLFYSNCTNITGNTMKSSCYGILLYCSNNNTVSGNTMINNSVHGIVLYESDGNIISTNNLTDNDSEAINLFRSDRNYVQDNNISNNKRGLWMDESSHNIFVNNNIEKAVGIAESKYNSFVGNNVSDGYLALYSCHENNIIHNNLINNKYGVYLASSNGNQIHHNNFMNNTYQAYVFEVSLNNTWEDGYPSGGNYWSDYRGADDLSGPYQNATGSDGIGDTFYIIDENNIDRYPLMKTWTPPRHDISVAEAKPPLTQVYVGQTVNITATIRNEGEETETFNVTCYCEELSIGALSVLNLNSWEQTILTFKWNTTSLTPCSNYTISVEANPVTGETVLENNRKPILVKLNMMGDINGDGSVNIVDIAMIARKFGKRYGIPDYDRNCDLNLDNKINIIDIGMAAKQFGKKCLLVVSHARARETQDTTLNQ